VALLDEAIPIARDDAVQFYGLADQIGDHHKKADVGIKAKDALAVPYAIHCQSADNLVAGRIGTPMNDTLTPSDASAATSLASKRS